MRVARRKSVNCEHTTVLHTIIREFVSVKLHYGKEWLQNVLELEYTRCTQYSFFHHAKAAHIAAKETDTLLSTNRRISVMLGTRTVRLQKTRKKSCEECRSATRMWDRRWFMLEENLPHFRGRNPTPQLHIAPLWT